jgi:hypothetical protein
VSERDSSKWLTANEVRKIFKIKPDELEKLVAEKKVKFKLFRNAHNNKVYKGYSVHSLEKCVDVTVRFRK